jgi:hypothetical protein
MGSPRLKSARLKFDTYKRISMIATAGPCAGAAVGETKMLVQAKIEMVNQKLSNTKKEKVDGLGGKWIRDRVKEVSYVPNIMPPMRVDNSRRISMGPPKTAYFLRTLGFIWLLPMTIIIWAFYVLPLWAFGCIKWDGWQSYLIARFTLVNDDGWYARAWRDWAGWGGPCVILLKEGADPSWDSITEAHEERHCVQQFLLGPTFYPAYFFDSLALWIFFSKRHAYLDNIFERDARRYAGQPVVIDPSGWPQGEDDRWPWW